MSAAVERLEELLARVQRNRAKPHRRRGRTSMRAPGESRRPHKPTPLEMAVEVELDRPKVQPTAARVEQRAAEPAPVAAKPAAPPAAAPAPVAAKPAAPPAAAPASPPPSVERRAAPLTGEAIEAPPLASVNPVVESTGEVPLPTPTTFGELMSRTLALRPK